MSIFSSFGEAVRAKREKGGWSQEVLAERAGLDRTYISGVERGVRNPTLRVIEVIATALDTTVSDLFVATEELSVARKKR